MKSRPIIFSAPMVRAILAGQKTQTRRVVKDEWLLDLFSEWPNLAPYMGTSIEDGTFGFEHVEYGAMCGEEHLLEPKRMVWQEVKCPYGVVGDRLWVRETYLPTADEGHFIYKADQCDEWLQEFAEMDCGGWKSPIFMPRAASRIELEITGIRVERVQDISEADARSEGVTDGGCLSCGNPEPCGCCNPKPDARDSYIWLWHKINGKKHPWSSNPWVWVVEFKRVEVQS